MPRTNIVIDHDLARRLMRQIGSRSLRETVNFALHSAYERSSGAEGRKIRQAIKRARRAQSELNDALHHAAFAAGVETEKGRKDKDKS